MELVPASLTFELAQENSTCVFKVKNVSKENRAFSIRTTNLLQAFRFRPSKAVLLQGESINVVASLSEEKRLGSLERKEYRCRDEFMVVSIPVDDVFLQEYHSIAEDDVAARKQRLNDLFDSNKSKSTKMVFNAFFIPPVQKQISALQERAMRSCLARSCLRTSAQLSDGSIRLSTNDVVIDPVARRGPIANLTIFNRCDYYVMYSVAPTKSESKLAVDPFSKGIIEPRESVTLVVSLVTPDSSLQIGGSPSSSTEIRHFVSASEASQPGSGELNRSENSDDAAETLLVTCAAVTDPDLIDLAMNVKTERDQVFDGFWKSLNKHVGDDPLWQGTVNCHIVQETERAPALGRRFSSKSAILRSKSSSTILNKTSSAMLTAADASLPPPPPVEASAGRELLKASAGASTLTTI